MRREHVVKAGAGQAMANFLGRAARCHAFGQTDRGDRLADIGNGPQIVGVGLQRGLFDL